MNIRNNRSKLSKSQEDLAADSSHFLSILTEFPWDR
jgi:hypothetical protein